MKDLPEDIGEIKAITLVGEDGAEVEFEHVLTFMYENERFMALIPAGLEDDEEAELVFMRVRPDKAKGDRYEVVENEVLCDELFEVFCELMDELDEEDGEEEDED